MPSITREDYAQLQAQAACPVVEGWKDGALTVWIAGEPKHFKGKLYGWKQAQHTREVKARAALALTLHKSRAIGWPWSPTAKKFIELTVYCRNPFDSTENLRLVCSPVVDALKPMTKMNVGVGLIDDDRDSSGHRFEYRQVASRKASAPKGIAIRIALATEERA